MKWVAITLIMFVSTMKLDARSNFAETYPPILQTLVGTTQFIGDRYGDFQGDYVAVLSDGSTWKIHPDSKERYEGWQPGEVIRAAVRTDWYWFKREHKFYLMNQTRGESVKAMIIKHKDIPLQIVSTDSYFKSYAPVYVPETTYTTHPDGSVTSKTTQRFVGYRPANFRKVLALSDGSVWVIKDKLNYFQLGMNVYVGAQGDPDSFYDFVLINGKERDAEWTMARPQI